MAKYPCNAIPRCDLATGYHTKPTSCPQYKKSGSATKPATVPALGTATGGGQRALEKQHREILTDAIYNAQQMGYRGDLVGNLKDRLDEPESGRIKETIHDIERILNDTDQVDSIRSREARNNLERLSDVLINTLPDDQRSEVITEQVNSSIENVYFMIRDIDRYITNQEGGGSPAPLNTLRDKAHKIEVYMHQRHLSLGDVHEAADLTREIDDTMRRPMGHDDYMQEKFDTIARASRMLQRRQFDNDIFTH